MSGARALIAALRAQVTTPADPRLRALRRMQRLATLLLAAMAGVFLLCSLSPSKAVWLGFVKAFAEAAVVGACADWFAVTALFRRPLGLPIPHTAIVPRNKERIGRGLGRFIADNFLAEAVLAERLARVDAAGWISAHLGDADSARGLARRLAPAAGDLLAALPRDQIGAWLGQIARRAAEAVPAAPAAGRVLAALREEGETSALYDRGLDLAETWVVEHEGEIRHRVEENTAKWIPGWVDKLLGDRVMAGLLSTLGEARAPEHPWRGSWDRWVADLALDLVGDSALRARGEALKTRLLDSPRLHAEAREIWTAQTTGWTEHPEGLEAALASTLAAVAERLAGDAETRETLNGWLRTLVLRAVAPRRAEIEGFIQDVVERWDTATVVERLELQVGRDLQYIRINGTLVGGLVGVAIHAAGMVI
jgi:uncharacterized membrane-anchored protein YjiN (DUF445 family)